jgi:hypothetical protein
MTARRPGDGQETPPRSTGGRDRPVLPRSSTRDRRDARRESGGPAPQRPPARGGLPVVAATSGSSTPHGTTSATTTRVPDASHVVTTMETASVIPAASSLGQVGGPPWVWWRLGFLDANDGRSVWWAARGCLVGRTGRVEADGFREDTASGNAACKGLKESHRHPSRPSRTACTRRGHPPAASVGSGRRVVAAPRRRGARVWKGGELGETPEAHPAGPVQAGSPGTRHLPDAVTCGGSHSPITTPPLMLMTA